MNTLKAIFERLDFWLRNEPYPPPARRITHAFDDLFDETDDPIRTQVYWAVRRFWINHWLCNWDNVYRKVKWAYQRVVRGWDDTAVWSIDRWLDEKMPAMLRRLKETKHGIPMQCFDGLPMNDEGYHSEPDGKIAEARWDEVLDKMIAGFEASYRINGLTYEDELGPYPSRRPQGTSKEDWAALKHERYLKTEELRKRDVKVFEEGMALFAKHYWDLWD